MLTANKRLTYIIIAVTALLTIPFIAMQFTQEVNWTFSDFVIAAILLFGTGLLCELVIRKTKSKTQRILVCGAILFCLVLVWIELAVGLFGSPFAGS